MKQFFLKNFWIAPALLLAAEGLSAKLPDASAAGRRVSPERSVRMPDPDRLHFIQNSGQITDPYTNPRPDIHFKVGTPGMSMFIGSGKIHYQFYRPLSAPDEHTGDGRIEFAAHRMDVYLEGADPSARFTAEEPVAYYERYYQPHISPVVMQAHAFEKVVYKSIYPNIDWVIYVTADGELEYDFVVHPGGRVEDIRVVYEGGSPVVNMDGSISSTTPMGMVHEKAPYSFMACGAEVPSRFVLEGNRMQFRTGAYQGTLTIDPRLSWSSYYAGGPEGLHDYGMGVAADTAGKVYIAGYTSNVGNFATTGSFQDTFGGSPDAFVARFSEDGTRRWSTYYGGPNTEQIHDAKCDAEGNILLAGYVQSPLAALSTLNSPLGGDDGILIKFDSLGARQWSLFYGGNTTDRGKAVGVDYLGNVYLTGYTTSYSNQTANQGLISTPGSHQPLGTSAQQAFLVKFNSSGIRQWGTYYGGKRATEGLAIACDDSANVFLAGYTSAKDELTIATADGHQPEHSTGTNVKDAFLVKFDSTGVRRWGTYYGGDKVDEGFGVTCDESGNVFLTGYTKSDDRIASAGSYQETRGDGTSGADVFIAMFDRNGVRQWGTYFGGPADEEAKGISADRNGSVWVAGYANSDTMVATDGSYQPVQGGSRDAFLAKFDRDGNRVWSSYYGGPGFDMAQAVSSDFRGNIYITGYTTSKEGIATTGSFQDTIQGMGYRVFLARFWECVRPLAGAGGITGSDSLCPGASYDFEVPRAGNAASYSWILPDGWAGESASNRITLSGGSEGGFLIVRANGLCDTMYLDTLELNMHHVDPVHITPSGAELHAGAGYASYQWYRNDTLLEGETGNVLVPETNGSYTVKVTTAQGCADSASAYNINNLSADAAAPGKEQLRIYPNPAGRYIRVAYADEVKLHITTLAGRLVMETVPVASVADISMLPAGLYLVRVTGSNGQILHTVKLVKTAF